VVRIRRIIAAKGGEWDVARPVVRRRCQLTGGEDGSFSRSRERERRKQNLGNECVAHRRRRGRAPGRATMAETNTIGSATPTPPPLYDWGPGSDCEERGAPRPRAPNLYTTSVIRSDPNSGQAQSSTHGKLPARRLGFRLGGRRSFLIDHRDGPEAGCAIEQGWVHLRLRPRQNAKRCGTCWRIANKHQTS